MADKKEAFAKLKEEVKKTQAKKIEEAKNILATRDKIERDYLEDTLLVTFSTSPETKRTILARRPNNNEMIQILTLSAQAAKYEGSADPSALISMVEIYKKLHTIAARLSIDPKLDEKFWSEKVSSSTLQSFISQLVAEAQKPGVSPEDFKKFR